ncbi:D-arabinono-1,4-lactone oxidase [uncultured Arcticibacterium sp.]|uniref:D-arabinono-1,4-lactone oxidase n=1 Tax=uncultured Arcticibacterium sp. TaxID=2173042 RepID=UPI0030F7E714
MKRKEFIKTSSAAAAATFLSPILSCTPKEETAEVIRKNWAGNYQYKAKNLYEPTTVQEVQDFILKKEKQKALGSCHCFNNIADSPESQISTKKLNKFLSIDEEQMTVTVEAGVRYGDFAEELHQKGYAIHNLASLPHISVAGAMATATHGSGVGNGNLATSVSAIEIVNAAGEVQSFSREKDGDRFNGMVVNLGALGIVTKVTLDIIPTFSVRQDIYQNLPVSALKDNFDEIMSSGYSVSLFTDWLDNNVSQIWIKRKVEENTEDMPAEYFGATAATKNLHPITALSAENCTEQMGVAGPWYERLPHFKMGFTPSSGEELQSEFFVPRENAVEAYLAIEEMKEEINPQLMISEIRTVKADDLWLSTAYKRESVAFHFTWKQKDKEVRALLPKIEAALSPFGVRCHWGKIFSINKETLHKRYERMDDFLALAKEFDPNKKFENAYLDLNILSK